MNIITLLHKVRAALREEDNLGYERLLLDSATSEEEASLALDAIMGSLYEKRYRHPPRQYEEEKNVAGVLELIDYTIARLSR